MLNEKLRTEIAPPESGMSGDLYGLQFGSELEDKSLRKIIICLDPTRDVILEAIKQNVHLIISHHGLEHQPFLTINDRIIERIKLLSGNNIDLFVMHTAWDAAPGGISEILTKRSGLKVVDNFYFNDKGKKKAIGRIGEPLMGNMTVDGVVKNLKRHLQLDTIRILGNLEEKVLRAAVVGGKGFNPDKIIQAKKLGCDTVIGGEFTHPEYLVAREIGMKIIESTHYLSEKIGMESLKLILMNTFQRDEFVFVESKDPITHI